MKRVMLDFETFGNGKNACVVQIGAVEFDLNGNILASLKINVDAESAVSAGGQIDAQTIYWWMSQSEEARNSVTAKPRTALHPAMERLNDFLKDAGEIWSHATFDFVILCETLKMLYMKPSFSYRAARDIRTLIQLAGHTTAVRTGTHHDALDDAIFQVKYVTEALAKIKHSTSST